MSDDLQERIEDLKEQYDPDAVEAWLEEDRYLDPEDALEAFEDAFAGIFPGDDEDEALGEYHREIWEHVIADLPDHIRYHVDWSGVGRDSRLSGDLSAVSIGQEEDSPTGRLTYRRLYAIFCNH